MKIVSIDPGLSTGVAICLDGKYITDTLSVDEVSHNTLLDYVKGSDQVIIEHFTVFYAKSRGKVSSYGLDTTEIVGMVMGYCNMLKIPLARQHPQNRKAFVKPAKAMGITNTRHEVDALAHLLAWKYKNES